MFRKVCFWGYDCREAHENPSILLRVDREILTKEKNRNMRDAIWNMIEYCYREKAEGTAIRVILKHLKGAFKASKFKEFKQLLFCNETEDSKKLKKLHSLVAS